MRRLFRVRASSPLLLVLFPLVSLEGQAGPPAGRDTVTRDSTRAQSLTGMTVTATRYETAPGIQPRQLEVITRQQIEQTAAGEITDVLKKRAGLDVVQYPGQLSNVGIRGFGASIEGATSRNLVLIDGRPAGAINLTLIDLSRVERVDVIKGPASTLYGSTAMGGVVNLITKRRTGAPGGEFALQMGSFGTTDLSTTVGGSLFGAFDADLSLRRLDQRRDFRLGEGNVFRDLLSADRALKTYPTGTRPDREVADTIGDGAVRPYTNQTATSGQLRLGYAPGAWRVDATMEAYRGVHVPSPGDIYQNYPSVKDVMRDGAALEARGPLGGIQTLARAHYAFVDNQYYDVPDAGRFVSSTSALRTQGIQLQSTTAIGAHRIVFGSDLLEQRSSGLRYADAHTRIAPYSPTASNRSVAVFSEGELHWLQGRLITTIGGRLDAVTLALRNTPLRPDIIPGSDRFLTFSPSAGLRWFATPRVSLHGTIGRAFLAPDPSERAGRAETQAGPGTVNVTIGNPNLSPETSRSFDLGISMSSADGAFEGDITHFQSNVSNRSVAARVDFSGDVRPRLASGAIVNRVDTRTNAAEARISGLEASFRQQLLRSNERRHTLALWANGTHFFVSRVKTPSITIDPTPWANQTNFDPTVVLDAIVPGSGPWFRIKNVAKTNLTAGLDHTMGTRFGSALSMRYVGRRLDSDYSDFSDISDVLYPASMTADLNLRWSLRRDLDLLGTVSNLTDENYYEKRGYNLPGRAYGLRLRWTF